jgi:hypothetical protein
VTSARADPGPTVRGLAWLALGVLAADVLLILLTPGHSLLAALGAGPVTPGGLAARLIALAVLLLALPVRHRVWALLMLPALLQFHAVQGRLSGDGPMYYAQLRSLARDGDIDLANEYTQLGLADRPELRVPTRTGLRRTVFSVGPALLGLPFFALAEALGRGGRLLGLRPDLSGYGPLHVNAVALGGLLYGLAAAWLVERTLVRHFAAGTARLVALLIWGATFLHWYMVQQPTMSHTQSAFAAAAVLSFWDRTRLSARTRDAALLGLLIGLAMCVRWQNAGLMALPAVDLLLAARRTPAATARRGGALLFGVLLGALPQMLVWRAVFGVWLLPAPPQGTDFVRLWRPFVLETLFSSRHGLLSWTPVLWAGVLGFIPLLRRRPRLALTLLLPVVVLTYVNMCSGDWWAGGSFSNRRFDSLLPLLAFAMAAAVETLRRALRRRPGTAVGALVVLAAAWNAAVVDARRHDWIPRDDTVAFDRTAEAAARAVAIHLGSPPTWPASWLFARRHGLTPDRYDLLAGRYLFYRQNSQRGCVEVAREHEPVLEGAWYSRHEHDGVDTRQLGEGTGQIWVGLDLPEDLELRLRLFAPVATRVDVEVNDAAAGAIEAAAGWGTYRVPAPRALWRRDLNAVGLRVERIVHVAALRFDRAHGEPSLPCGMEAS